VIWDPLIAGAVYQLTPDELDATIVERVFPFTAGLVWLPDASRDGYRARHRRDFKPSRCKEDLDAVFRQMRRKGMTVGVNYLSTAILLEINSEIQYTKAMTKRIKAQGDGSHHEKAAKFALTAWICLQM
jgi:hypothetical protein